MPRLRLTVFFGLTFAQIAVGSLIATLAVSDVVTAASSSASHTIAVGPGFSDVSPHQLVRTAANLLYALAPTCDSYPSCPANSLRVYRADQPGTPGSFAEQDTAHRPAAVGSVAVAIDSADVIHALWNDRSGNVNYGTFSTATNTWSPAAILAATSWTDFGQGDEGVALALDSTGIPHAVWSAKTPDGVVHLFYANKGSNWSAQQIDDIALTGNRRAMHPALAFEPDGTLLLAWLEGTFNYVPDGIIHTRSRSPAGAWATTQTINDTAMTTIDNGPSLLVTPDGTAHLVFLNAGTALSGADTSGDYIHYYYNNGGAWIANHPGGGLQISHDPSLGPGPNGTVRIYGHGWQGGAIDGHGDNLYSFEGPGGAGAWGPWTLYATGSFDSSVSTRWAQFFHTFPTTLDIAYWADPYPNLLFVGTDTVPATRLAVGSFPAHSPAGISQSFTVTAQDAVGNPTTAYTGTVHFTSSDSLATLPPDYTFTAADSGAHTFSATLKTAGNQSLSAADTAASDSTGTQAGIVVSPVLASISPTLGPVGGGDKVTLMGAGFTNAASVTFDAATAANVQVGNSTTITAITPPHMAGTVDVTLAIAGSTPVTLSGAYTYGGPNPLPVLQPTSPPGGAMPPPPLPSIRPSGPTNVVGAPNPLPRPRQAGGWGRQIAAPRKSEQ